MISWLLRFNLTRCRLFGHCRIALLLASMLASAGCGDRFYKLDLQNGRNEMVKVYLSDSVVVKDLPSCEKMGRVMAYDVGDHLTIRVTTMSGVTIYDTTVELGSVDNGIPEIRVDLPAEDGHSCSTPTPGVTRSTSVVHG